MHEPLTADQRAALAGLAGQAAHLVQNWAEVGEDGKHHLLKGLGESLRQLDKSDADAERPDARPEWCTLATHNPSRGLTELPPVEDRHGSLPTGYTRVRQSSAAFVGAMWVDAAEYGDEPEQRMNREVKQDVALHYQAWQARRLAYQLLTMAEHVDPGGGTEPPEAGEA